jgi:drug/metabolite transporter (DMT)-like permease
VAIALALLCALTYGAADFCGGLAAKRAAALAVFVWSQAVGFAVLLAALPLVGGVVRLSDLWWGVACGLAGAGAVGMLYRALAIGTMGVVSPITAVLAAVIPVLFAILRGERPPLLALAGIGCALVAVVLVSAATAPEAAPRAAARRTFAPGIPEAIASGTAFGFFFIAIAQTHPDAGLYPLVTTRIVSMIVLGLAGGLLHIPLRIVRSAFAVVATCGALDMAANIFYVLAAHRGPLAIVAVISSLYPASTVALAAVLLHERLGRSQWAGVGIALGGVVCISLAR